MGFGGGGHESPVSWHGPSINLSLLQILTFQFIWLHHAGKPQTCTNNITFLNYSVSIFGYKPKKLGSSVSKNGNNRKKVSFWQFFSLLCHVNHSTESKHFYRMMSGFLNQHDFHLSSFLGQSGCFVML